MVSPALLLGLVGLTAAAPAPKRNMTRIKGEERQVGSLCPPSVILSPICRLFDLMWRTEG
jgi:hypothetical protein